MKILKNLLLLTILTSMDQRTCVSSTNYYAPLMFFSLYRQPIFSNPQILSSASKSSLLSVISPAHFPLQTSIDRSFQLLNRPKKAAYIDAAVSTSLIPTLTKKEPFTIVTTQNPTTEYTDKELRALQDMNKRFHFSTKKKNAVQK